MADFGSLFDNAKGEADKQREDTRARVQSQQDEKKARLDEGMRPINDVVEPLFQTAATQLQGRGVKLRKDVNSKLLYENGERKPARTYQMQLGHNRPGSIYHFSVLSAGFVICQVYSSDHEFSVHHSGRQALRCRVEELTSEMVEEIVRSAVDEVGRSK